MRNNKTIFLRKDKKTRDFACMTLPLIPRNRSGWIEIVEAVVSILLVATVLLITINKGYIGKSDISESVYKTELSILREVETNNNFRTEILTITDSQFPVAWINFPADIKKKIIERTPNYLNCTGRICKLCESEVCNPDESLPCNLEETMDKDVYSQSVIISATLGEGAAYRRLKLFCWTK
jgi:hypothetical protein